MRVRVWIDGLDGASRDFELVGPPRLGERVCISSPEGTEEGFVEIVSWQLQAAAGPPAELAFEGDPPGSVSLVHVICRPLSAAPAAAVAAAAAPREVEENG